MKRIEIIVPDSGPLITLAAADALDVLLLPKAAVVIPDMVRFEVIRDNEKPGASKLARWMRDAPSELVRIASTETFEEYVKLLAVDPSTKSRNRGELAASEVLANELDDLDYAILLFEDSAVRKQNFLVRLPDNVLVLSTAMFLEGLERKGLIDHAEQIMRRAVGLRGECIVDKHAGSPSGERSEEWHNEFDFGPK